jgi:hypothetical protein
MRILHPTCYPDSYALDIHKVFIDEIGEAGRGPAYDHYGIDGKQGAAVIVRPDHCMPHPPSETHDMTPGTDYAISRHLNDYCA